MKIYIVHVMLGYCRNNSDGKLLIAAETEEIAKIIAKQHTDRPIFKVEEVHCDNEILFSSFALHLDRKGYVTYNPYGKLGKIRDNWGDENEYDEYWKKVKEEQK